MILETFSAAGTIRVFSSGDNGFRSGNSHLFPNEFVVSSISHRARAIHVGYCHSNEFDATGTASLTLTGANTSDFTVDTYGCPQSIQQGGTCYINVFFVPTGVGPRIATLTIADNTASSPQTVQLTGIGQAIGTIQFSPATLDFGNQGIRVPSAPRVLILTNPGSTRVHLDLPFTFSGDFQKVNDTCNAGSTNNILEPGHSCTIDVVFTPQAFGLRNGRMDTTADIESGDFTPFSISLTGTGTSSPLAFVPIAPCRVADTRFSSGFPGIGYVSNESRNFSVQGITCGIPTNAVAYAMNVTAVPWGPLDWLTIWPAGDPKPLISTLNSSDGRIKTNAAIVPAGTNGDVSVFVNGTSHVILDVNGYFAPSPVPSGLQYYRVTPCRLVDTRRPNDSLGGPSLLAKRTRDFPLLLSPCGVPADAQAYSLNFTAIPKTTLGYLSVWPSGQGQPGVSTLNAPTGATTANAAIIPAGQGGDIRVFATDLTDLIIDVDGYFAPPSPGDLSLYLQASCRVLDTRNVIGSAPITEQSTISINNACAPPPVAQALVANATVVPSGPLSFLTLWPSGNSRPNASTLNAYDGTITSNMAIVPIHSGALNAFASDPTHLVLDVGSYFAP